LISGSLGRVGARQRGVMRDPACSADGGLLERDVHVLVHARTYGNWPPGRTDRLSRLCLFDHLDNMS
jgi:hypothetical protein